MPNITHQQTCPVKLSRYVSVQLCPASCLDIAALQTGPVSYQHDMSDSWQPLGCEDLALSLPSLRGSAPPSDMLLAAFPPHPSGRGGNPSLCPEGAAGRSLGSGNTQHPSPRLTTSHSHGVDGRYWQAGPRRSKIRRTHRRI
jgi:hypothetical protein